MSGVYSRSTLLKIGIGSLVLAMIFIVGLIQYIASWDMFYANPVTVDAIVIGNDARNGTRGSGIQYYPIVTYECGGQEYTETIYDGNTKPIPEGTHLSLTVDGDNPQKQLSKPEGMMMFVGILVSAAFLAVSIAVFIERSKMK